MACYLLNCYSFKLTTKSLLPTICFYNKNCDCSDNTVNVAISVQLC